MPFAFSCIIQFIVATLATLAFAVLFSAPRSEWLLCGINGAVGWLIYYIMLHYGWNDIIACAAAAIMLTVLARILAVVRRNPVTMYVIPGIFPLVPGSGIYYTAYYIFQRNAEEAAYRGLKTFEYAAAIVVGIVIGTSLPQQWFNYIDKNHESGRPENVPENRTIWGEEK